MTITYIYILKTRNIRRCDMCDKWAWSVTLLTIIIPISVAYCAYYLPPQAHNVTFVITSNIIQGKNKGFGLDANKFTTSMVQN